MRGGLTAVALCGVTLLPIIFISLRGVNPMRKAKIIPMKSASEKRENAKPLVLRERIGSTTYVVSIFLSKTSKETMGDKITRMIASEAAGQ